MNMNFVERPRKTSWFMRLTVVVLLLLTIAASGTSYYFYRAYSELKNGQSAPKKQALASQNETEGLVATIGQFLSLPDETPTIATVTDPEKLSGQAFFANAKTGYKVLIFSKAKKAILYDPVSGKIIEVAPLLIDPGESANPTPTPTDTPSPN